MTKYSDEFKLKIVQEYLNGYLRYLLLAQKYGIPSPIKQWVNAYNEKLVNDE
jgi:transposase